jgi:hypothetical protein
MSVTFARVSNIWSKCNLSRAQKAGIKDALASHGRAQCHGGPVLPVIDPGQSGPRVRCLFFKYYFEIECDPARSMVSVFKMGYYRIGERKAAFTANPDVVKLPYVHPRDRRAFG